MSKKETKSKKASEPVETKASEPVETKAAKSEEDHIIFLGLASPKQMGTVEGVLYRCTDGKVGVPSSHKAAIKAFDASPNWKRA